MFEDFTIWDGVGLVGALTICAAYFAVSRRMLDPEGARYQLMNLGGAILLLISLYFRPNPGAILIEAIWVAIALTALLRIFRRQTPR